MSSLINPLHERFCRGRALGLSWRAAFRYAGYSAGGGYAARLARKPEVQARVRELREERDAMELASPGRLVKLLMEAIEILRVDPTLREISAMRSCVTVVSRLLRDHDEALADAETFDIRVREQIWRETGEVRSPDAPFAWTAAEIAEEEGDEAFDAPPLSPQAPSLSPHAPFVRPDAPSRVTPIKDKMKVKQFDKASGAGRVASSPRIPAAVLEQIKRQGGHVARAT